MKGGKKSWLYQMKGEKYYIISKKIETIKAV